MSWSTILNAAPIALQQATATFSQPGFEVGKSIDGDTSLSNGWAIANPSPLPGDPTPSQIAVYETVSNIGFGITGFRIEVLSDRPVLPTGGPGLLSDGNFLLREFAVDGVPLSSVDVLLTFTMSVGGVLGPGSTLGNFQLSFTTDDRSTFADGLLNSGDVTANWILLDPISLAATNGVILSSASPKITHCNAVVTNSLYTIGAVASVPEPSAFVLVGVGVIALLGFGWRYRKRTL